MKRTVWAFAFLVSVAATISCQQPPAESPKTAPPAATPEAQPGPDPTVVDSGHYSVELENERLRVLRIKYGPGEASVMHHHPAGMAVFLTPVKGTFEMPDGTIQDVVAEAGQAMLSPAGQHLPRNGTDEPFEVVQVELKDGAAPGAGAAEAETGPDPTEVDPSHYTAELENDRLRIVRIKYGPGEESVMHHHPAGVAIFLTPAKGIFEMPDGTTQEIEAAAGQAILTPAGQHRPRNTSGDAFEVIQVELKD